jgi:hypothetical protein
VDLRRRLADAGAAQHEHGETGGGVLDRGGAGHGTTAVGRAFLAFAAAFFVFHQIGTVLASDRVAIATDLATPFAVAAATAALLIALDAPRGPVLAAIAAGVLYVDGHGIHLAANSIHNEGIEGDAVYFWDERFGHIEAVLGWFGLVAAVCAADRTERGSRLLVPAALLLGWTFFTSTVEGQTWWLEMPAAALFAIWAWRSPSPLRRASAAALLIGAALIGAWAAWHGGVPEFSDL